SDSEGASHGQLTATAEGETVHSSNHRFAKILDQLSDALRTPRRFFALSRSVTGHFRDVRARGERFVAAAGQNNASHIGIVAGVLKGCFQFREDCLAQCVEHLWAVEGHVRNWPFLLVKNVLEFHRRCWRTHYVLLSDCEARCNIP